MFAKPPHEYLGIENKRMQLEVDIACAVAVWEDENRQYKESQDKAQNEALDIDRVLMKYREQVNDR